jgi:hypothetical protein
MTEEMATTIAQRFASAQAASAGYSHAIELSPPPEDAVVRLLSGQGSDEINVAGKSYRPDKRAAFFVPQKHVTRELLTVGSFYPAPISKRDSLQDVGSAIHAMPDCPEKVALAIALADLFEPGSD